ncbi:hypothetical protein GH733_019550 [Mirounga leonina]|nr:hypothetical protein GH733_019550 [Mirounga leonina]
MLAPVFSLIGKQATSNSVSVRACGSVMKSEYYALLSSVDRGDYPLPNVAHGKNFCQPEVLQREEASLEQPLH